MSGFEQELLDRYAGARARLMGAPTAVSRKPAEITAATTPIVRERLPSVPAPIDLLSPPSWRTVAILVALKHRITLYAIRSGDRSAPVIEARQQAVYEVRAHCPWLTNETMGRLFHRDPTTIHHSIRREFTRRAGMKLTKRQMQSWPGAALDMLSVFPRAHRRTPQPVDGPEADLRIPSDPEMLGAKLRVRYAGFEQGAHEWAG